MRYNLSPAERHSAPVDNIGHSSVQPWSAGPYFPAIVHRQDVHETIPAPDGSYPLRYSHWLVTLDGVTRGGYASHDDAEMVARGLVNPLAVADRKRWSARDGSEE
jgi:hypothetical protein